MGLFDFNHGNIDCCYVNINIISGDYMKSKESIKDCQLKKELECTRKIAEKAVEAYDELLREQYGF